MKVLYSAIYHDDGFPFNELCSATDVVRSPDELKEHDAALIIWGGADIHPSYYGHMMHPSTHPGGMRDRLEWSLLQRAIEMGMPIIGVCRGAQMACAAAGGWLIQDVRGHAGYGGHDVTTKDGKSFNVNSIHHQMMAGLENVEHELVAWSTERRAESAARFADAAGSYGYQNGLWWTPPEGWVEPEFVYFNKIKAYAIQWHPEGMQKTSDASQFILNYIRSKEESHANRMLPVCVC